MIEIQFQIEDMIEYKGLLAKATNENDLVIAEVKDKTVKELTSAETRILQIDAYTRFIESIRASGQLNDRNKKAIRIFRAMFNIDDECHATVSRKALVNTQLRKLAESLASKKDALEMWELETYSCKPKEPAQTAEDKPVVASDSHSKKKK